MNNNLGNKATMAMNIKRYMDMYGYSSKEMAKKIGVSQSTFSYWLSAKFYPRIDRIEKMAKVFNVTKADLVEEPKMVLKADIYNGFSPDEHSLILLYRKASDLDKDIVRKLLSKYEVSEEPETEDTASTLVS